jgi:hypothetical protein
VAAMACEAAAASGLAPTPKCCSGANIPCPLGPGVARLDEPRPTFADELKEF